MIYSNYILFSSWKVKINDLNSYFRIIVSLILWSYKCSEAAVRIYSKDVFFKILQNLQKNTCSRVCF